MPQLPGWIGGSATTESLTADGESTVNLYVEKMQSEAAANGGALFPCPGFAVWSTVADVGARALTVANGRLFGVMGAALYEWDVNGTATLRGALLVDANQAQLVFNGVIGGQLGIASGGSVYCFTLATNVLTGPFLNGGYSHLAYAGGFGLAFNGLTGKVNLSALNDLSTWSAGLFFQRSLFADPWQAMWVDANNLIWLAGTDSFEVWYNTGSGTQPWAPLSGLVGRYGIAAPFAFASGGSGNVWLSRNLEGIGQIVQTRGSAPTPISSYAVDTAVAGYLRTSRIDNAEVLLYQQGGHAFANVSFPSAPATWTVDTGSQSWAQRGKWNPTRGAYDLWTPRVHVVAFGKHLVGDRTTGSLAVMDTTIATELDGTGIRRLRRGPFPAHEHKRLPIDQFELLMDVGLGVAVGQGSDPQVMLRVSPDVGRTWGTERQASVGKIGAVAKRVYWTRLGAPPASVVEVSYSEPTPFRIVDAYYNNAERAA